MPQNGIQRSALAIDGGKPVRTRPLPPWPHIENEEIESVVKVLRSNKINYWTGEEGKCFEREFAAFTNSRYAIALANGSLALDLALIALDIGVGDEVIVTPRSFIASASCVPLRGAQPVFADVDTVSQNITARAIEKVLTPRTRAVIVVHLAGWPCDMDSILELSRLHGFKVIEDCAQAHGASYKGRPVGGLGDVGAFSFCQDKIFTTGGEGGMLTTNSEAVWLKAWSFKEHGKSYDLSLLNANRVRGSWKHASFGTNYRLTEMQAAMGRSLLGKVDAFVKKRRSHAHRLNLCCQDYPSLRLSVPAEHEYHSYYRYYVFVQPERLAAGWTRDMVLRAIVAEGIPCSSGTYGEIYREEAFAQMSGMTECLPVAHELAQTALAFLVHPTLTNEDIDSMCAAIRKVMDCATAP